MDLFVDPVHGPPPWNTLNFWGWIFTRGLNKFMDKTVTMFSILSGLKAPHQLLYTSSNFSWNYSIHGFGLVWKEKQYLKGRSRKEVVNSFFFVSSYCVRIDTKTAVWQNREEKEMHNDWVPSPDISSLDSPSNCLLFGKLTWILLMNQALNDLHIIKQGGWSNVFQVGSCNL